MSEKPTLKPSFFFSFFFLLGLVSFSTLGEYLFHSFPSPGKIEFEQLFSLSFSMTAVWALVITLLIILVFYYRASLFNALVSFHFAVVLLAFLTVFTILGTLLLQNEDRQTYLSTYGSSWTAFLYALSWTHIFHSWAFQILLIFLVLTLLLVLVRRNPFRPSQWGFLFSHGGIILLLVGALVGMKFGEKGYLDLFKGRPTSTMDVLVNNQKKGSKKLPFTVLLSDFKVERYPASYKIYTYELEPAGDRYRVLSVVKPEKKKEFQLPGGIRRFRLVQTHFESPFSLFKTPQAVPPSSTPPYVNMEVYRGKGEADSRSAGHDSTIPEHRGLPGKMSIDSSKPMSLLLMAGRPLFFDGERFALSLEKRQDIQSYQSILTLSTGGRQVTRDIEVNNPLSYHGYQFYQSNYHPEDPNYSGVLVVRDPGLPLVYLGFIFICVGVIYIFYVKKPLLRWMALHSARGGPSTS